MHLLHMFARERETNCRITVNMKRSLKAQVTTVDEREGESTILSSLQEQYTERERESVRSFETQSKCWASSYCCVVNTTITLTRKRIKCVLLFSIINHTVCLHVYVYTSIFTLHTERKSACFCAPLFTCPHVNEVMQVPEQTDNFSLSLRVCIDRCFVDIRRTHRHSETEGEKAASKLSRKWKVTSIKSKQFIQCKKCLHSCEWTCQLTSVKRADGIQW